MLQAKIRTPSPSPRKPKQRRSRTTQKKILSATVETIAEKGFDGSSTHEIAMRAGVKQSLVMYHFSSKEELCWAAAGDIIESFTEPFLEQLKAMEQKGPAEKIEALFHSFIDFSARHPELHRFMIEVNKHRSPHFHTLTKEHLRPAYEFVREQIRQAQSAGTMIGGDPAIVHYTMIGVATSVFSLPQEFENLTGRKATGKAARDGLKRVFSNLFFRRVSGETAAPPRVKKGGKR
jgi:AcrR family transcriptional regulator